jgi:hypothetical protein
MRNTNTVSIGLEGSGNGMNNDDVWFAEISLKNISRR